jgi:hypothetical protein
MKIHNQGLSSTFPAQPKISRFTIAPMKMLISNAPCCTCGRLDKKKAGLVGMKPAFTNLFRDVITV